MKRRGFFSLLLAPFVARFAPKPLPKLVEYLKIIRIDRHTRTVYFDEV